jgi:hypothetical protein
MSRGVAVDEQWDEAMDPSPGTDGAVVERREAPRIEVTLDARCRRLGRPGDGDETATVDVSHGGARIAAPAQLNVGDVIQLAVQMPHGIELTLQGLVVQLSGSGAEHHAHVAFDSLSTAAADLLTELLQEQADWQAAEAMAREAVGAPGDLPPGA